MEQKILTFLSLLNLQGQIYKRIDQGLYAHGVGYSEFLVMYYLDQATEKCMRRIDLAEQIGLSASGVTRLLNPMEKNRLVQKESNPRDARVSLVKLSTSGQRVLSEAMPSFEHVVGELLGSLSKKKLEQLSELIHDLDNSARLGKYR